MTDQSDTGNPTAGLGTGAVKLTVTSLIAPSHHSKIQFPTNFHGHPGLLGEDSAYSRQLTPITRTGAFSRRVE
eukprot:703843-Prorocentrum_minimum.AAC.1